MNQTVPPLRPTPHPPAPSPLKEGGGGDTVNQYVVKVLANTPLGPPHFLLETESAGTPRMGQFYMLRAWDTVPVLSRPISVHDTQPGRLTFLCKQVGQGTAHFARLKTRDAVTLLGPLGNGFPDVAGKVALVGGGVGIGPLYLAAKHLKAQGATVSLFLGFSETPFLVSKYRDVADTLSINAGGYITDHITPADFDVVLGCGPEVMLRALFHQCAATPLYVSLENRMACGVGACFVCSRLVAGSNKKVCKDGPVFPAEEVYPQNAGPVSPEAEVHRQDAGPVSRAEEVHRHE